MARRGASGYRWRGWRTTPNEDVVGRTAKVCGKCGKPFTTPAAKSHFKWCRSCKVRDSQRS